MRYLKLSSLAIIVAVMFSCSSDIEINADYKDVTVVYGLISPEDSVHYIKINKAFSGDEDANIMAQNSGNFSYPAGDIVATIEEYDGTRLVKTFPTTRVVNEVIKDAGIFDSSNNVLYRFEHNAINRNYKYKLKIVNTVLDKDITAETEIVSTLPITSPRTGQSFRF